jgi:hypothetical protein
MPTDHILSLLIAERDKLNAAITLLQGTPAKRRGRPKKDNTPPAWVTSNGKSPATRAEAVYNRQFSRLTNQGVPEAEAKKRARQSADAFKERASNATATATAPARKKRTFSAAQRKEQAARMRKYWAAKKKATKKEAKY